MSHKKKCFKCKKTMLLDRFYKHKKMKDGHLNKCIDCAKKDAGEHRFLNIDKIREYDRNRPNHKERIKKNKLNAYKYRSLNSKKEWRQRNKEKILANEKIGWAVSSGHIEKMPCLICGNKKSQGHHEDYSEPLEVIWLCSKHHAERHRELNEIKRRSF